jgi:hypothetical protein
LDLCGSVLLVWLVELLDGLFRSWDVLCLEGGDVAAAAAAAVVVVAAVVVGLVAAAVLVVTGGMVVEGGCFLALLVEAEVEPVRERLAERRGERNMQCLQVY